MRNAAELQRDAWEALVKSLGLADALRYKILFQPGTGDYAKEREALFGVLSIDDWLAAIERQERDRQGK